MAKVSQIAAELDRLCPSQVDEKISGNGQREAGHTANESKNSIGWCCDGGSVGNLVCVVPEDQIDGVYEHLRNLPDAALDAVGIKDELAAYQIDWHI